MLRIELIPTLIHCVESLAREHYDKCVQECLRSGEVNEENLERIEILRAFLESMDFSRLRQQSEKHLVEGGDVRFVVYMQEGKPQYEMNVVQRD